MLTSALTSNVGVDRDQESCAMKCRRTRLEGVKYVRDTQLIVSKAVEAGSCRDVEVSGRGAELRRRFKSKLASLNISARELLASNTSPEAAHLHIVHCWPALHC